MQTLRRMRVPGDSLFALGELTLVSFIFRLGRKKRSQRVRAVTAAQPATGGLLQHGSGHCILARHLLMFGLEDVRQ